MRRLTVGLFIVTIACLAVACEKKSGESVVAEQRASSSRYPQTLSEINGWHGIQVGERKMDTWVECRLTFPTRFGSSQEEKAFLVYLVSRRAEIVSKTCQFSPVGAYQALDQLLLLVKNEQDSVAAKILLFREFPGVSLNLDGELAEGYTESYVIPVLETFNTLNTVLDQAREDAIAKDICAILRWREDLKDTKFRDRVKLLVEKLKVKGMVQLALEIQSCK